MLISLREIFYPDVRIPNVQKFGEAYWDRISSASSAFRTVQIYVFICATTQNSLQNNIVHVHFIWKVQVISSFLEDIFVGPFCGAPDTPVLDFWWGQPYLHLT